MTGGLEIVSAALTPRSAVGGIGIALSAIIIAIVTVLRRGEFSHTARLQRIRCSARANRDYIDHAAASDLLAACVLSPRIAMLGESIAGVGMWEPWKGPDYKGLLLLGESCYDWEDGGVLHRPKLDHPTFMVGEHKIAPCVGSVTMVKLTRALCNSVAPSPEQSEAAWNKVAFTNYVPGTVGYGARVRPSRAAWKQAEAQWKDVLENLKPKTIIVLGLTMWRHMPTTQVVIGNMVQGYHLSNGDTAMCHAVRHPSWGPPWHWYSTAINATAGELI